MPIIDPTISLAFSIHSKNGIYALLLGSGLSRAAGIPTGWEIVLDLIQQLARTNNEDCDPDPETWYLNKYGEAPNYSKILRAISSSPTTRNQILRSYFEPTHEERDEGLKQPTQAHKSIANLVKHGLIKVILTTNFDRLIEKAMEEAGVTPIVISTPDAIRGVLPLAHLDYSECILIKLHADYLDTRIKNSPEELEKYDRNLNKLIDRIFDEYGLLVCGWSAEWDGALRDALTRCKSHRFQTFWAVRVSQGEKTNRLIELRKAERINIIDADTFFKELEEKVFSLDELHQAHPLSVKTAVTTLKRLLRDESQDIRLEEFVKREVEITFHNNSTENFPIIKDGGGLHKNGVIERIRKYESYIENLLNLMTYGCYWGKASYDHLWERSLQRIANPYGHMEETSDNFNLRLYPSLLLLYGGGIASISANKYKTFAGLLIKPSVRINQNERSILEYFGTNELVHEYWAHQLLTGEKSHFPLSSYLSTTLRGLFRELIPSEIDYQKCFDRFEYLFALAYLDHLDSVNPGEFWIRKGFFIARNYYKEGDIFIPSKLRSDINDIFSKEGDGWSFLNYGLFNNSAVRFKYIKDKIDGQLSLG